MLKTDPQQTEFVDFYLPFNGRLSASNRWVKLAGLVPWDEVEHCYRESFAGRGMGAPAKSGRLAYGALLIKERLGITDEETVVGNTDTLRSLLASSLNLVTSSCALYLPASWASDSATSLYLAPCPIITAAAMGVQGARGRAVLVDMVKIVF